MTNAGHENVGTTGISHRREDVEAVLYCFAVADEECSHKQEIKSTNYKKAHFLLTGILPGLVPTRIFFHLHHARHGHVINLFGALFGELVRRYSYLDVPRSG